jgi:hypothetical protein
MLMRRNILAIGIFLLFVISSITPIIFNNVKATDKEIDIENYNFDRYLLPEYYDCYNVDELPSSVNQPYREISSDKNVKSDVITNPDSSPLSFDGLMDSAWPMYCHDTRHTGRSSYSTIDTWDEIWRYKVYGTSYHCAPVIDSYGVIYVGRGDLYAIYPNGTLKWIYDYPFHAESAPALDENGIVYIGTVWAMPNYLYAVYANNGTLKWKYPTSNFLLQL